MDLAQAVAVFNSQTDVVDEGGREGQGQIVKRNIYQYLLRSFLTLSPLIFTKPYGAVIGPLYR